MSDPTKFTLEELSRIALGIPEMSHANYTVLHCLLNILIKKLDCEQKTIQIKESNANDVRSALEASRPSLIVINNQEIVPFAVRFYKVDVLQQHINGTENKLKCHFDAIKKNSNLIKNPFESRLWNQYAICENPCVNAEQNLICTLTLNKFFINKIKSVLVDPVIKYTGRLKRELDIILRQYSSFKTSAERSQKKIRMIEFCMFELGQAKITTDRSYEKLESAIIEIQKMLDAKLDRVDYSALKKYFTDTMDNMADILLAATMAKPDDNLTWCKDKCLSCGSSFQQKRVFVTKTKSKFMPLCHHLEKINLFERFNDIDVEGVKHAIKHKGQEAHLSLVPSSKGFIAVGKIKYQDALRRDIGGGSGTS